MATSGTSAAQDVTPPVVKTHVDATFPRSAKRKHVDVILIVTIDVEGHVTEVEVAESGGADLDEAAISAVRQWTFEPAHRGEQPIASRIRVPFHFAPPAAPPAIVSTGDQAVGGGVAGGTTTPRADLRADAPEEVTVEGETRKPSRGASDIRLDERALRAAPHVDAGELLRTAPGMYVARVEGDASAQKIYLRGFDADHGQDVEFRLGGIPLNQSSHIHGQGYTDLNFIIPEVVRSLRVIEGVYDPKQGDFAVAGSAEFELGVREREHRLSYQTGSFGTQRVVGVFAPKSESEETFGAAQFRRTDGFGPDVRGGVSGGMMGQYKLSLSPTSSLLFHGAAHAGRANSAGVLRRDDIAAGRVDFYDAYADASARAQSTAASRFQIGVTLDKKGDKGARTRLGLWLSSTGYRSRNNFSGYVERSQVEPSWIGRGDLIEQSNSDLGIGLSASHRTSKARITSRISGDIEFGAEARAHSITQGQNLLKAPQNETWDRRVDADIRSTDVGAYVDGHLALPEHFNLRGGARADLLAFDVDDKLGNFIPAFSAKTHIIGFRRTAAGTVLSPRINAEWEGTKWFTASLSYGQGFRSPTARELGEGERAPFAKVRSYELGATFKHEKTISVTASLYQTDLSYDLAFDAAEGRLERIGPTTRRGFALRGEFRPVDWMYMSTSATFVRATLDEPPAATPDRPNPAYKSGELLPNVPPLVVRADMSVDRAIGKAWGKPLKLRAGYGFSFLSNRPLQYGQSSPSVFFVDAQISVRRDFLELGLQGLNLLDSRYAATEYAFVSNWQTRQIPSYLPMRHIVAGAPQTFLVSATCFL